MSIRIQEIDRRVLNMRTRMPFKYGIATLTALPHLMLCLSLDINGRTARGLAAEGLPPKWFTKNPQTSFQEELAEMFEVIHAACRLAQELPASNTVFDLWLDLYRRQGDWAKPRQFPALLWHFGVSLVERAVLDAFCRATHLSFAQAVRRNTLGIRLGEIHRPLAGQSPADLLPAAPLRSVTVRHTVGLSDPLTGADLGDGLPQALDDCIQAYGLTHLKIKLCGNAERDLYRLRAIARLVERTGRSQAFTLDGNEQYHDLAPFRALWDEIQDDPRLRLFFSHLIAVEQPLHRDVALSDAAGIRLRDWPQRPPIIIDESDGDLAALPRALELGYTGTSHKNCKGVIKGVANACLLEYCRRNNPQRPYLMTGEDLASVGPIAMHQDVTVAATLGIEHVERNGHHYFKGLSMWPQAVQEAALQAHGDLYRRHRAGFPTLRIQAGRIALDSLIDAPFGYALPFDPASFASPESAPCFHGAA